MLRKSQAQLAMTPSCRLMMMPEASDTTTHTQHSTLVVVFVFLLDYCSAVVVACD